MRYSALLGAGACVVAMAAGVTGATAMRDTSGFALSTLPRNDDGFTYVSSLGFAVNLFGTTRTDVYVSYNGNVTFDDGLSWFDTVPLNSPSINRQIIAPFFADVDTRNTASAEVTYGTGTIGGRNAFVVNWDGVGYYRERADKLNKFQLVLIDRSDVGAGDFDFEFNYDQIQWDTGEGWSSSARAGYANRTGTSYELPGSAVNGAFLDSNPTGLIHTSNVGLPGRYAFTVRDGVVEPVIPEPMTMAGVVLGLAGLGGYLRRVRRA